MIYITAPFAWVPALKHYMGRKNDKNCIKKSGMHMAGKFSCHNSHTISMKKAKDMSKKLNMTFNDMMMGVTSKVLKQHFIAEGDKTESISVTMPFSFKTIPLKVKDYVYGNQFVALTIYLKLYEDFK